MIQSAIVLLGLLFLSMGAAAQEKPVRSRPSAISDIDFYATNIGLFGMNLDVKSAGFIVPRGSTTSYLFGSGLWFGAQRPVRDSTNAFVTRSFVFLTYNPNSAVSWATPGEIRGSTPDLPLGRPDIYRSSDYDTSSGRSLIPSTPEDSIPNWPLWALPGRRSNPLDPGLFEPHRYRRVATGMPYERPAFVGEVDEQFTARFHDMDLNNYEANAFALKEGYPIRLQFQQNIYAWRDGRFRHTVVVQYDVINVSNDTLHNCVVAQVSDPDLGISGNDRMEYYARRPELRVGYVWTDFDTTGHYDTLAIALLEAPMTTSSGFIDNSRRSQFRRSGTAGGFSRWTPGDDPHTSAERYNFMVKGSFVANDSAADQKSMMASRIFSMLPGDTAHFAIAYGVLDAAFAPIPMKNDTDLQVDPAAPNPRLEGWAIDLMNAYYSGKFTASGTSSADGPEALAEASLSVIPNPATDVARVRFALTGRSETRLRVVSSIGGIMIDRQLGLRGSGVHEEPIDTGVLPAGTYLVVVQSGEAVHTSKLTVIR